jgi:CBS domain-containing protein
MSGVDGLRVQDVMNRNHPSLRPDELATKARAVLRDQRLRVLPVVDERKRLLGVISRNDVMTISSSVSTMRVKGIMSEVRFKATGDIDAIEAAKEMMRLDEWYAPVVKSEQENLYVGMLGLENVIRALYEKKVARLSTPLSEAMSTSQLLMCSPDDDTDNVWKVMQERSFAACPVVVKGKPVGVLTQQNLIESGATFPEFEGKKGRFKTHSKIVTIMRTPVVSLRPSNTLGDAIKIILAKDIGRIIVTDDKGLLIGIVDREDVLRSLLK